MSFLQQKIKNFSPRKKALLSYFEVVKNTRVIGVLELEKKIVVGIACDFDASLNPVSVSVFHLESIAKTELNRLHSVNHNPKSAARNVKCEFSLCFFA